MNVEFLRSLSKLNGFAGFESYARGLSPSVPSVLVETADFGSNPGALKMYAYVPDALPRHAPLVVVLHGCGQSAAAYDLGTGWSTLARQYGFALLMPEQQASNNGNTCFNWFAPGDIARGEGEAGSIRAMIAHMVGTHKLDQRRIYITGLSAGGAMTSVMLATYPDVFAAGAIIAGLPFGIAGNVREALTGMMQPVPRPGDVLGDLVRRASSHRGPWPKISVWHGSADRTVNSANAREIVKQWLDVHGLPSAPMAVSDVDGYPHEIWWNAAGETVVESYSITDMAHGTPLGLAANDERYGLAGAFLLEAGISSSYHIADFFGLTGRIRAPVEAKETVKEAVKSVAKPVAKSVAKPAPKPAEPAGSQNRPSRVPRRRVDVGSAISRALTAAGLKK